MPLDDLHALICREAFVSLRVYALTGCKLSSAAPVLSLMLVNVGTIAVST